MLFLLKDSAERKDESCNNSIRLIHPIVLETSTALILFFSKKLKII